MKQSECDYTRIVTKNSKNIDALYGMLWIALMGLRYIRHIRRLAPHCSQCRMHLL